MIISEALQRAALAYSRGILNARLRGAPPPSFDSELAALESARAHCGLFVTLRTVAGDLRGCIGRMTSERPWIELLEPVTLEAAFHDYRFKPVGAEELPTLRIEHSVLTTPQAATAERIRIGTDGVILTVGSRRAVFLPEVAAEQGWTIDQTLEALARKGGMSAGAWRRANATIEVFQSVHYGEEQPV